ncbi:Omega amidase [Mariniradius saccharolyticus AK6]|uniref:Omega-amidase YafV n=1 Tax=Mariniradius saccharolyticus AK6 TaxID=1239962 RepID=M7Y4R5_9BACT|nr:amidohydrolase [Mariniradius saccharolyticus]EMS32246.1 Omega amidase [Mariniradius saccharolyticus AK6]
MKQIPETNLRLALVQTDLFWKDIIANLAMIEEKILNLQQEVDLIALPEMFPTGFTMDASEVAEPMNLTVCKWLLQMARQTKAVVTGSAVIQAGGKFYNRLLWARPDGKLDFYDKRHLFRMANEHDHYDFGKAKKVFEWKGWRILPQICYDLRFPVWSRNQVQEDGSLAYDLMVYVASWPKPRINAWDALLKARAIENLSYAVGVNRVGQDGNGIPYSGHSGAYNFKGETLVFSEDREEVLYVELDAASLAEFRQKFPAWMDADDFSLRF